MFAGVAKQKTKKPHAETPGHKEIVEVTNAFLCAFAFWRDVFLEWRVVN